MRCRREANSPAPLIPIAYDAADSDVVVMDQVGLLIGVGIAAAAGEGSHGGRNFRQTCQSGCPYCAPVFLGHTSRDSIP
jgi:hypothetical protein